MVPSAARFILVHHRIQSLLRRPILLSTFKEDFHLRVMVVEQYRSSPANFGLNHLRVAYIKS